MRMKFLSSNNRDQYGLKNGVKGEEAQTRMEKSDEERRKDIWGSDTINFE